jgi:hypothetical protein
MLELDVISFSISMSLLFFCFSVFNKQTKKLVEKMQEFSFLFFACQILLVFLPDISVHCALIDNA